MAIALSSSGQESPSGNAAPPEEGQPQAAQPQDAKPKKPTGKPGDPAAPAPRPAPQNLLPPLTGGDKVYMVSGTVVTGVQVLRSTPRYYEIEMVEGQPPLQIPRRQVKNVEYDDIDPARDRLRREMFPEEQEVTIASGERVTGALRDKLMAPVSAELLSYIDQDLVKVLDDIRTKTQTKLQIDPSIEEKPASQRRWSVEIPPDKTLMALLREDLVGAIKYAEVVFEADTILVLTKEAAKARQAASTAANAPAAGAPAPADATAPATPPAAGLPGTVKPPAAIKP